MKTKYYNIIKVAVMSFLVMMTACVKDLDTIPLDDDVVTSEKIYLEFGNYAKVLAKCYAGLALSGQQGPHGNPDISGLDEGASTYTRALFYAQEISTDEAILGWNDGDIKDYNEMDWSTSNAYIRNMFARIYYQISICNEFLRESTEEKLNERGFTNEQKTTIALYRAEARFLRAFSYYHALDLFGNVPFVTEKDAVGSFLPDQKPRSEIFDFVEKELLEIETQLLPPKTNVYGRVDRASAWMLLARLYLNAVVYGKTAKYTEAITYAKKVIDAGYELEDNYAKMFMADNHTAKGIIFAIPFDGKNTKTWGGTTFLVNAQVGGKMTPADFGISGGWWGLRVRPEFVDKFPTDDSDKRKMFFTDGQTKDIAEMFNFTHGYAVMKWKNVKSTGGAGQDGTHPDTDEPVFRLADAYLIYAEAVLRGGTGGSPGEALNYVNQIRTKAYGNTSGNITQDQLTLDFILDERARELYWENHRRTDLIRYGLYTGGTYKWQWKGGVQAGTSTSERYNLYPIPDADMGANPKLKQNEGY